MAVDPVCKMTVEPARAAAQSSYKGETYYFCAVGCKQKFDREPEKYLAGGTSEMAADARSRAPGGPRPLRARDARLGGQPARGRASPTPCGSRTTTAALELSRSSRCRRRPTLIREARAARRWPATSRRPSWPASPRWPAPRMVGGLTRQVVELVGEGAGGGARRGRHHRGRAARASGGQDAAGRRPSARPAGDALECWALDTTGWVDLPNSCFTYSDGGPRPASARARSRRR